MDTACYVETQRAIVRERERASCALGDALRARLPELILRFAARGVTRVVLFGSFARGDAGDDSDVDLAVVGVPPAEQLGLASLASRIVSRPVDLVRMEGAIPTLRARIEAEGEVLLG